MAVVEAAVMGTHFFAIKAVNNCRTGYARHWNETHVNLVRYCRGSKQMRNNEVDV